MADGAEDEGRVEIRACPECGSSQIGTRLTMSPKYLCSDCRHEFEEPVRRPAGEGPKSQG